MCFKKVHANRPNPCLLSCSEECWWADMPHSIFIRLALFSVHSSSSRSCDTGVGNAGVAWNTRFLFWPLNTSGRWKEHSLHGPLSVACVFERTYFIVSISMIQWPVGRCFREQIIEKRKTRGIVEFMEIPNFPAPRDVPLYLHVCYSSRHHDTIYWKVMALFTRKPA